MRARLYGGVNLGWREPPVIQSVKAKTAGSNPVDPAICPRIKPGEGARPILSVGLSAFKGGRVVRVPSRRPRPESEPRRKKTHGR